MASCNSTFFLVVLVAISAIVTAAPSSAIGITPGPVPNVSDVIRIDGFLYCTVNTTTSPDGCIALGTPRTFTDTAAFLMCGNKVLAKTTEFNLGLFRITLNSTRKDIEAQKKFLVAPASNCTVAVTTPHASCNATVPAGNFITLVSSLYQGLVENFNGSPRIHHLGLGRVPLPK
ncbi:hypothetical protein DCAR_0623734 [Daucus carota subsp. sativus]|uniref:Uncharacterized protein n=1 Tax=Daucus carota subsp. sativus TaxID=79200 RepID=A0A164VE26_DAUCS|nr:PREDICTED: uncharacterized protein LOC108226427 [Daucus carota subsp. sativus]WOH04325.1 hypothetical protein DCAR_0623734 [Daucus carota subsp. sativus]